jgi:Uri superfamily endonuclease
MSARVFETGSGGHRVIRAVVRRRRVHDHQDVLTRHSQIVDVMIEPPF